MQAGSKAVSRAKVIVRWLLRIEGAAIGLVFILMVIMFALTAPQYFQATGCI